ncbi:MAG: hypothetical protein AB7V42_14365 [Thermoleophilia bacterium]
MALLMLALLTVKAQRPERRPPVDPIEHIRALVREPVVVVRRPARPVARRPAPARPRRPPAPRPTALVPVWW